MDKISCKLEMFEGPLDLLLYLISKNKLNIYDIPLAELFDQYMGQIRAMESLDMDVASEFLEMAARLVYLKTVSLLPTHEEAIQLKEELTGELLEYRTCREIAARLSTMTEGFGSFVRAPEEIEFDKTYMNIHKPDKLLESYLAAAGRGERKLPPPAAMFSQIVAKRIVSVSSKIVFVLRSLWSGKRRRFSDLFSDTHSRSEMVATFLAVLELVKARRVTVTGDGDEANIKVVKGRQKGEV